MTEILTPGAVGAYACLCTDAAATLGALPQECIGHREPLTGQFPNPLLGGVAAGHECGSENPCPALSDRPATDEGAR